MIGLHAENKNLSKLCVAQLGKHGLKGRLERVDFLIKMQDQIANLDHIYDIDFAEITDLDHIDDIDYAELILIIMNMLILLILMMIWYMNFYQNCERLVLKKA